MKLPIFKERIPYKFELDHEGALYEFEVHYNSLFDFFTIDLSVDGDVVVYGEKMSYGQPLFRAINNDKLPKFTPFDSSEKHQEITYDNFCEGVTLQKTGD